MIVKGDDQLKVLVAGGAGFIGRNLTQRLLALGHDVCCIDNFACASREGIQTFSEWHGFSFIEHDVCHPLDVSCDVVFNLASIPTPRRYMEHPVETASVNFLGTLNLLRLSAANNAIFVQASSSEIYGEPHVHPQTEDYSGCVNPIGVRACYKESKRVAETLCFDYQRVHAVDVRVARIFNTYGPMMSVDDGRVVSNFVCQALLGKPLSIFGNGKQTRSFCYVDDLVEGLLLMSDSTTSLGGPVNLGSRDEVSVLDLAKHVLEITGSSSELSFLPLGSEDPAKRQPSIDMATKQLGWTPRTPIEVGLRRTVEYFQCESSGLPVH